MLSPKSISLKIYRLSSLSLVALVLAFIPIALQTVHADVNISTCDQLLGTAAIGTNLRDNAAETYIQQNDIDCGGQSISVNFSSVDFTGVYDGNGFTISNFSIPSSTRASLFGYTDNATIQNLTISNADVVCSSGGTCAILAADDNGSTFNNVSILNSTLYQNGGQSNMGGIVGVGLSSQISNINIDDLAITCNQFYSGSCLNVGGVAGSLNEAGGIKASISSAVATNLLINAKENVGGIVGFLRESEVSNSSAQGTVNGNSKVGGIAGYMYGDATYSSVATNVSANTTFDPQAYLDLTSIVSSNSVTAGGVVGLMGNYSSLDCSGSTTNYTALGLLNSSNIGGIVGQTTFLSGFSDVDSFKIQNCTANVDLTGRTALGGIVGNADEGRMSNVFANGSIRIIGSNPANIGGIVGTYDFDSPSTRVGISTCGFDGQIFTSETSSGAQNIGGVAGDVDNISVDSCNVTADLNAPDTTRIAGIIGQAGGTNNSTDNFVSNSSYSGDIKGRQYVAGILGNNAYYDVFDSNVSGSLQGNTETLSQYFGGITGFSSGSTTDISVISGSSSSMDMDQIVNYAGGIIGYSSYTSIIQSYSTGDVDVYSSYAGGIVGSLVSGTTDVVLDQVYSTGNISAGVNYVGGLVGYLANTTQVSNVYSIGKATGKSYVGGLFGLLSSGSLTNSFSAGLVDGVSNTGGLSGSGNVSATITDSYWDTDTSGRTYSYSGEGKTTLEMYTPATFASWDTTTIWEACDNAYPVLRNLGQSCPVPDPVIFTVNNSSDTSDETPGDGVCADSQGVCTLRSAFEEVLALNSGALNVINFNLPSTTTISLQSALPALSNLQFLLDGTTQPGYSGQPLVAIDGSAILSAGPILDVSNADDSTIKGLAIYGLSESTDSTIEIVNSDSFTILNNFFGLNLGEQYVATNVINSISIDNSDGLSISGNKLANAILSIDSNDISITTNNLDLSDNLTSDYAIQFVDGQNAIISKNTISNIARGIVVRDDSASDPVTGNQIRENTGYNVTLMIDLLDDANLDTEGKNANDLNDEDDGPNTLLNSPILTSASYDNSTRVLTIDGTFNSNNGDYRFDFYSSNGVDEAREYLSYFLESITSNNLTFTAKTLIVPEIGLAPSYVTATAQDAEGNTSEHSDPIAVDAILITSCDQLAGGNPATVPNHVEMDYSGFYRLANDIDCSTYTGGNSFDPIGSNTASQYFKGVLDGAGYIISNLEINESSSYTGLFARTQGAIIQNLTIENVDRVCSTTSGDYCGVVAGYAEQTSFKDITLLQGTGVGISGEGSYTGAIAGYALGEKLQNINSDIDVLTSTSAELYTGGLVGYSRYYQPINRGYQLSEYTNVTVNADISGYSETGGIVGYAQDVYVDNASYTGQITHGGNTVGGLFGSVTSYLYSSLTSVVKNSSVNLTSVSAAVSARNELGGAIGDLYRSQLSNVTVEGVLDASNYTTVGGAIGYAAGDNSQAADNQLLTSTGSTIQYVDVDADIADGNSTVGGFVGNASYYKINNVSYSGEITHSAPMIGHTDIGGLVGTSSYIDLRNASATSTSPISYALTVSGGAVGTTANSYFDNVSSDISLPGVGTTGGGLIASASNVNIYNSYATGDIGVFKSQSSTAAIGGLVGRCVTSFCNIYNSYATGDVTGERITIGGLVGHLNATNNIIQNSYATGNVLANETSAGGLIGQAVPNGGQADIINSYATGTISSVNYAYLGGVVGQVAGGGVVNVTESYFSGAIDAPSGLVASTNKCGGLVGESSSELNILRSYSYGDISCPSIIANASTLFGVGGLVGEMDAGSIIESYSHSDITVNFSNDNTSEDARVGGLVGYISAAASVTDSYAAGYINDLYTPGVPGDAAVLAGLVAESPSTSYTDSFWDTQATGVATSAGGTGLLTSEMQDQDSFTTGGVTWNFTPESGTWEMCPGGGYPTHQWMNYCPLDNPYEFIVNSTSDTDDAELGDRTCLDVVGDCTLRAALQELSYMIANEQESVAYNLNFDITGVGPHIITLDNSLGVLPSLSGVTQVTINGESEPNYVDSPVVFVDGSTLITPGGPLLTIDESSNMTLQGLGFINLDKSNGSLLSVQNSNNITLDNNYFAIDSVDSPDSSSDNTVSGLEFINTTGSLVSNSKFGRNLIIKSASDLNTIQDNEFNLVDSALDSAIYIESSNQNTVESNQVQDSDTGIIINQPTGQTATRNLLTQNTATGLTNKMIELQVDGVASADTNDIAQDLDGGANTLLNFPLVTDGEYNSGTNILSLQGTVETSNGSDYYLEFYNADGSSDEALNYLGASDTFTVADNLYNFDVDLSVVGLTPLNATAILIDANGNTSQHSQSQSLNDPPSDILISQNTFPENADGVAFDTGEIATFTAVDSDLADTHTFEIVSVDGDEAATIFSIGGLDGDSLIQNSAFDYETKTSYSVLVRTTDNKGVSFEKSILITITDLNDNAPDLLEENFNVSESNPAPAATLTVNDVDTVGTISLTITGGADQNDFEITGNTIEFKEASLPLDFETKSSYTVQVTASDGVNTDDTETFTFSITDVNEAPVVENPQSDINATQGVALNPINLSNIFYDQDAGANGELSIQAVETGQLVLPDWLDLAGGVLSGTPSNADVGSVSITVTASDQPGLTVSDIFTINVLNANDAPIINNQTVGDVSESGPDGVSVGVVVASDPDSPYGDTLSYSITSGNVDSDGDLIFPFSIDSETGEITLDDEGDLDYELSQFVVLQVTVTDDGVGNLSSSANITISITDANDESPIIISPGVYSILENSTEVGTIQVTDADALNTFSYYVSGGLDADLLQVDPLTGVLSFIVAPDNEGPTDSNQDNIYQVEVSVDDGNSNVTSQLISIQVTNVEEDSDTVPSNPGSSSSGGGGSSGGSPFPSGSNQTPSDTTDDEQSDLVENNEEESDSLNNDEDGLDDSDSSNDSSETGGSDLESESNEVSIEQDASENDNNSVDGQVDSQNSEDSTQDEEEGNTDDGDENIQSDDIEGNVESQNQVGSGPNQSQGGGSGASSYKKPVRRVVSCDNLSESNLDDVDYADLDCNPLDDKLAESSSSIRLNLSEVKSSKFPGRDFYITGKVYDLDGVDEVELYAELSNGNNIILGRAKVDDLGSFSLLNQKELPEDNTFEIKAVAVSKENIVSPDYPVLISGDILSKIPTNLVSFAGKPEARLFENEDGYFSFISTSELLSGLELRLESRFRTKHNVYWNSVLVGSAAITGSNSDQVVVYAPEEVVQDIKPFSSHKITIVAENIDNPDQKGSPLVVRYIYVPTVTYYISILLLVAITLSAYIVTKRRHQIINDSTESGSLES